MTDIGPRIVLKLKNTIIIGKMLHLLKEQVCECTLVSRFFHKFSIRKKQFCWSQFFCTSWGWKDKVWIILWWNEMRVKLPTISLPYSVYIKCDTCGATCNNINVLLKLNWIKDAKELFLVNFWKGKLQLVSVWSAKKMQ